MQDINYDSETACNPDCIYVPAQGWWCRQCGAFRDLDDTDLCADCRVAGRRQADPRQGSRRSPRR